MSTEAKKEKKAKSTVVENIPTIESVIEMEKPLEKEYIDFNTKIEIRPIPNSKGIEDFSTDLKHFAKIHTVPCLVNPDTHRYETGLSKEDLEYLEKNNCPYDVSDVWVRGKAHPFWDSLIGKVDLKPRPDFLYPGKNILDFIKYKYLLKSKFVYTSESEMLSGSKPMATHYIYNESVEVEIKASKLEKRNRLINKIADLSLEKKREFILIINNENVDNKSESYLTIKFEEILNSSEKTAILESLFNRSSEDITIEADVKKALNRSILKTTTKGIYYYDTLIGYSIKDVIEAFKNANNQDLYLNIKAKF